MSNLDKLQDKVKDKIKEGISNKELAIEINNIKEVVKEIVELIKTRNF